jgi:acetyl-CoA C-acetyltransferase
MKFSHPVHIVDARRSPIGRFGGGLKSISALELSRQVAENIVPARLKHEIGQVILGQVLPAGSGMNVARQLGLQLGLPQHSPAFTVNMVCGSGLKAVALAASAVSAGETHLALAGGTESMSRAPHYATDLRWGRKLGDSGLIDSITCDGLTDPLLNMSMGETAERLADTFKIPRESQDEFALRSHRLVGAHREEIRRELVPISTREGLIGADESPRIDTDLASLRRLRPVFRADGSVTAGNASSINDGAALVLLADDVALRRHELVSRARIIGVSAVGCDPAMMGLGPVPAIRRLVDSLGWNMEDIDAFEINEAFAVQTLACAQELQLDTGKLNRRGGAIALGHPVGCSGARVLVTLLHILEDLSLRRGIAALCIGGGMGIAAAVERA